MEEIEINIELKPHQRKSVSFGEQICYALYKIPCEEVYDIFEFGRGFLSGVLASKGFNLGDVVFHPADTIQYVNTPAKAIYCWEYKGLDGNMYYEFETTFSKGE